MNAYWSWLFDHLLGPGERLQYQLFKIFTNFIGAVMAQSAKAPDKSEPAGMVTDETILKIAKEISIKFIEVGRITPATFEQSFKNIFSAIDATVRKGK